MGCFTMSGGEVFGEQETLGMWAFWGKAWVWTDVLLVLRQLSLSRLAAGSGRCVCTSE